MRNGILTALVSLFLAANQVFACSANGRGGFVEENDLWIGANDKNTNGMTEEAFNKVLDRVEAIYAPIIAAKGKKLQVIRKWEDGTVNAYAQQSGNIWKISMFGGLARHETITEDAFATVACHELGHHLGGYPKKGGFFGSAWASNEGQSDYWGTMKCLRKYYDSKNNDDQSELRPSEDYPQVVKDKCANNFANQDEVEWCQMGSMAGLSLGNLFRALRRLDTPLKFDTPDRSVVSRTNHKHPAPQCRLDTYFAGSLCEKGVDELVSNTDYKQGVCARVDGYTEGVRPTCWFKAPRN